MGRGHPGTFSVVLTRARVLAVGALLVGVIGSYAWLHTGNHHKSPHHVAKVVVAPDASLTRALAYVSSSSPVIGAIQTDQRRIAMQAAIGLEAGFLVPAQRSARSRTSSGPTAVSTWQRTCRC